VTNQKKKKDKVLGVISYFTLRFLFLFFVIFTFINIVQKFNRRVAIARLIPN